MKKIFNSFIYLSIIALLAVGCQNTKKAIRNRQVNLPQEYSKKSDSTNSGELDYNEFFDDQNLITLIDSAVENNQELNMTLQEIEMMKAEIGAKKGEYLPSLHLGVAGGADKKARYTSEGASEATTDIFPGKEMPEPMTGVMVGAFANWEIDIWHKLRNAKKSAVNQYLSSVEGKNFMLTQLVSEIGKSYYELLAMDNSLSILDQNIKIQSNALKIVRLQKQSARANELAVKRLKAEVLHTKSLKFALQQKITEAENKINFLVGRYPQHIDRSSDLFFSTPIEPMKNGVPSQLLENRPDIRAAEYELVASKLDVKVARAKFYPSISINAGVGFNAFNLKYLFKSPASILYNIAGDLMMPLLNRKAIKADYKSANAKQLKSIFNYEKVVLKSYIEVANEVSRMKNLDSTFILKSNQVDVLQSSVVIANKLFRSARANYLEVLLTQRDALESKFDLVEVKLNQFQTRINLYRSLGGVWR